MMRKSGKYKLIDKEGWLNFHESNEEFFKYLTEGVVDIDRVEGGKGYHKDLIFIGWDAEWEYFEYMGDSASPVNSVPVPKIVQLLDFNGNLLGLGDDGVTYVMEDGKWSEFLGLD